MCYNTNGLLPIAVDIFTRHDPCQAHVVSHAQTTIANHEFSDSTTVSVRAANVIVVFRVVFAGYISRLLQGFVVGDRRI